MDLKTVLGQAIAAHQAGNLRQAEAIYGKLLAVRPDHPQVSFLLGTLRNQQGRPAEALALLEKARAAKPDFAPLLLNLGNVLQNLGRFQEAVARYDEALAVNPSQVDALDNRGNALGALDRPQDALASFDAALAIDPGNSRTWFNRGTLLLQRVKDYEAALGSLDRALALRPDYPEAINNHSNCLLLMKMPDLALAGFDRGLALQPDSLTLLMGRGAALMDLGRYGEALTSYERVLAIDPDFSSAFGQVALAALYQCDWARMQELAAEIPGRLGSGRAIPEPWVLLNYSNDGLVLRQGAEAAVKARVFPPLWRGERYDHSRIRIGYISADFRSHPVAIQLTQLLAHHDRARFEIVGISTGPDDGSDVRAKIVAACDQFHDLQAFSMEERARRIRDLEIDIAIDLGGHTAGNSLEAFARRPAPIQISWLGHPGTTGASFMDYILGDEIVMPLSHQPFYAEKIVRLPDSFFPMDTARVMGKVPTRAEAGLPADGFVFCCFNRNWKVSPAIFDIWMQLLQALPDSILWLKADHASDLLSNEAAARGIDPARLIFAANVPAETHLARHKLADLFLDTLPYNAHATAADALLAGLPVLTWLGNVYPGRVGASLVTAAGLPELVTHSAEEYKALALTLARDPARLAALREKLTGNRMTAPLFDTRRFARNLESALEAMLPSAKSP